MVGLISGARNKVLNLIIYNMEEAIKQAFIQHPFGVLIGIALIIFVIYIGFSLLANGWPNFKKK